MNDKIYDSVFRTMLNDCTPLIIPIINEVFGEHYRNNEKIELYPNENMATSPEGDTFTRITDSNIVIIGDKPSRYHIECESSLNDNTMLIRMYEYDTLVALMDKKIDGNSIRVTLPKSAILYLRHNSNTPNELEMIIESDEDILVKRIPTIKAQNYSVNEIFNKELYFLLPFHIFVYEKELSLYNEDEEKLKVLVNEYQDILSRLFELCKEGIINDCTFGCIRNGMKQVLRMIAHKYSNVVEKGEKAMGGEILDYPEKTAWREGIKEGQDKKEKDFITKLLTKGKSVDEIADLLDLDIEEVRNVESEMYAST